MSLPATALTAFAFKAVAGRDMVSRQLLEGRVIKVRQGMQIKRHKRVLADHKGKGAARSCAGGSRRRQAHTASAARRS